ARGAGGHRPGGRTSGRLRKPSGARPVGPRPARRPERRKPMSRLCHIEIDDSGLPVPTPEIEQERRVAIYDLLEENSFVIPPRNGLPLPEGPFRLLLCVREGRLVFDLTSEAGEKVAEF